MEKRRLCQLPVPQNYKKIKLTVSTKKQIDSDWDTDTDTNSDTEPKTVPNTPNDSDTEPDICIVHYEKNILDNGIVLYKM